MAGNNVGIGMIGTGFMAEVHLCAWQRLQAWERASASPMIRGIVGDETRGRALARRFGSTWLPADRRLIEDDSVHVVQNLGRNARHAGPTIAAARAGRHVFCEKPLALNADEAFEMWEVSEGAGVVHMCGFNYRFLPAIRLAREWLEEGLVGQIHRVRLQYLSSWALDPTSPHVWRLDRRESGHGALGDIGSHVIDLARYLVGEITAASAVSRTVVKRRGDVEVDVDDAVSAVLEFDCGAAGTFEVSRVCAGHGHSLTVEINGSAGALLYDMNDLNALQYFDGAVRSRGSGFARVRATADSHPFSALRWPYGLDIGWSDTFLFQLAHLLGAILGENTVAPHAATFEDGYRAAVVCDAIARAAATGERQTVTYAGKPSAGDFTRLAGGAD